MGAFDPKDNIPIPDDEHPEEAAAFRKKWRWDPHEIIIDKGVYNTVDQETVENAGGRLKGEGRKSEAEMRIGSSRFKLLEVMIVDWTLTLNGRRQEVSRNAIARLPSNYRTPVLQKID